jgi:hypothetical protein
VYGLAMMPSFAPSTNDSILQDGSIRNTLGLQMAVSDPNRVGAGAPARYPSAYVGLYRRGQPSPTPWLLPVNISSNSAV